ncbi:hypothetical protein C8Q74DRAFT_1437731 [Fomes fomentarius]|nr:hypothetical protein C8Q74DRAFT_1437731 [Fomes fomentarius]
MASTMTDGAPAQWTIRSPTESETSVRLVRAYLAYLGLPAELVLYIMDLASYYPAVYVKRTAPVTIRADRALFSNSAAQLYLVTPPLPRTQDSKYWAAREVIWHIESRDQRWGGEALVKYHPAWSRHDACIFRRVESDSELPVEQGTHHSTAKFSFTRMFLQNITVTPLVMQRQTKSFQPGLWKSTIGLTAARRPSFAPRSNLRAGNLLITRGPTVASGPCNRIASNIVVWTAVEVDVEEEMRTVEECGTWGGKGFVQTLRSGDKIGLMMRVMHPRWANDVLQASIEVVYNDQTVHNWLHNPGHEYLVPT